MNATAQTLHTTPSAKTAEPSPFDVEVVRAGFPILNQDVTDNSLVYLDNAATTQKPQPVIDYLNRYYALQNSNIHRAQSVATHPSKFSTL